MDEFPGLQQLYVFYPGGGSQNHFTAPSDFEAANFLKTQTWFKITKYASAFIVPYVYIKAKGAYWINDEIGSINIIRDLTKNL